MADRRSWLEALRRFVRRLFKREEDGRVRDVVDTLSEVGLFRGFSRGMLQDLANVVHLRSYRRDEFIYYERDPGLGLYVVQEGRVRLLVEDDEGGVQELRQVGRHGAFGKLSVLGDFRRMDTAQALTDTRVLGFFRPDLRALVKRHPRTGAAVLEALACHLAAQQIELVRLQAGRDGKVEAIRALDGLDAHASGSAHRGAL